MRAFFRAMILAALLFTATFAHATDAKKFNLKVVDEQGQPLQNFEAQLRSHSKEAGVFAYRWTTGSDGVVRLLNLTEATAFDIILRADGYASTIQSFTGQEGEKLLRGEASVTLPRGQPVKLHFRLPEGLTWPKDMLPEVYFESFADQVRTIHSPVLNRIYVKGKSDPPAKELVSEGNLLNARAEESGDFSFRISRDTPPFYVAIQSPGFLRCFEAGPFKPTDIQDGVLTIDLPEPATLEVLFDPGEGDPASRPFKSTSVQISLKTSQTAAYFGLIEPTANLESKPLTYTDLPPATLNIAFFTSPNTDPNNAFAHSMQADPGRFFDKKQISLRAGQSEKIKFWYVPLDSNAFRGQRTAVLRIETPDGKPAAGREVAVNYYADHYGTLPVFSGAVPESGEIVLNDVSDAKPTGEGMGNPYSVRIGNERVGGFSFKTSEPTERFNFRCPPIAGDMAPDVELLNVADGKTIKLSDLRGKLVVLDFWATWCGPCQPALEKLDTLAAEKADAWKDRVLVVPVSIDDEPEKAKTHLIARGWTHLNTYWTGAEGKLSFEAPAMQAFVVKGVPASFLIDPSGRILWRGHPLSNEGGKTLEDRIEAAMKQPE